ncbi:hypothetical protein [Streptomyces sp. WAC 04229]|uniref:hypothetical protein n=1 Tax=Streptomyces sp. WAC 04229 TaxID=2203206 RepID=UPI0021ADF530|nr:hypothetical protein [Streptomyces sp. WAC 04229]
MEDVATRLASDGQAEVEVVELALDCQLSVPGTGAHLLLTFSTPLVQIADAMGALFDAMAGALTWMEGDGTGE